jgi:tetratricopeptide (TPR) repeat protein
MHSSLRASSDRRIKPYVPEASTRVYLVRRSRGEAFSLVLRRLRSIFGQGEAWPPEERSNLFGLDEAERERIGTENDPLRGFEAAMERHEEAERAEQSGDPEKAIELYERSVAEEFVGSHPYERLASLHERRHDYEAALRVSEAFLQLAASGKMPKGAQRSADRKRPWFEARIEHYRRLLDRD